MAEDAAATMANEGAEASNCTERNRSSTDREDKNEKMKTAAREK